MFPIQNLLLTAVFVKYLEIEAEPQNILYYKVVQREKAVIFDYKLIYLSASPSGFSAQKSVIEKSQETRFFSIDSTCVSEHVKKISAISVCFCRIGNRFKIRLITRDL